MLKSAKMLGLDDMILSSGLFSKRARLERTGIWTRGKTENTAAAGDSVLAARDEARANDDPPPVSKRVSGSGKLTDSDVLVLEQLLASEREAEGEMAGLIAELRTAADSVLVQTGGGKRGEPSVAEGLAHSFLIDDDRTLMARLMATKWGGAGGAEGEVRMEEEEERLQQKLRDSGGSHNSWETVLREGWRGSAEWDHLLKSNSIETQALAALHDELRVVVASRFGVTGQATTALPPRVIEKHVEERRQQEHLRREVLSGNWLTSEHPCSSVHGKHRCAPASPPGASPSVSPTASVV